MMQTAIPSAAAMNNTLDTLGIMKLYESAPGKASIREIVSASTLNPTPITALTQNLIGYWKFDEKIGITASDSSGNANKGTIKGAAWITGEVGNALSFNGSNNFVDVANGENFNFAKALTIEAWIKPAATYGSYGVVGKKEWSSTLTGYHFLLHGNRLDFDAGNGNIHTVATSGALSWTTGTWYHVAVTFDSGTVNFYRNGVNIASSTTVSQIANNSQDLYVGSTKSTTYPFNGAIDEVKIYNRALSASEVQGDYKASQKAIKFNGYTSYVEVPDHKDFSIPTTGSLTVSFWLRPDAIDFAATDGGAPEGAYVKFFGKGELGQYEWYFRMYDRTNSIRPNRMSFYIFNLSGGNGVGSYFQDDVTVGKWIHVAGKVDNKYIYIYKNGVLRDKDDYTGSIHPQNGNAPLRIGTVTKSSYIKGALDDITMYNRSLTDTEIAQIYKGTKPRNGVVAEWKANEGSGSNLNDSGGRNHNGKLYGNTTWTTGHMSH